MSTIYIADNPHKNKFEVLWSRSSSIHELTLFYGSKKECEIFKKGFLSGNNEFKEGIKDGGIADDEDEIGEEQI